MKSIRLNTIVWLNTKLWFSLITLGPAVRRLAAALFWQRPSCRTFCGTSVLAMSAFLVLFAASGTLSAAGLAGTALQFDGDDIASVADNAIFHAIEDEDALTIEAWIHIDSYPQGWFSILDKYSSSTGFGWTFQIREDDNLQFVGGAGPTALAPWSPTLGQCYYVSVSYDRANGFADFYVDGALLSQQAYDADIQGTDASPLYFGYNPSGGDEYDDGQIDEVRIWNRALSAGEIASHYNRSLSGGESGLVAYWRFDEGAGTIFADSSSSGLDGVLVSESLWIESCALLVPEPATCASALVGVVVLSTFGFVRRRGISRTWPRSALAERIRPHVSVQVVVCALLVVAPLTAYAAPITVPPDLNPGDQYRLAFVTSTFRNATSADIEDYNAFVTAAANSVPELVALATTWKVIGSTPTVDARDNTDTNPNVSAGVPIYTLGDDLFGINRIADDNADLWDGLLAYPINTTETGSLSDLNGVYTGTIVDGTKHPQLPLGSEVGEPVPYTVQGLILGPGDIQQDWWVFFSSNFSYLDSQYYAISGVLTVVPEPSTLVLGCTGLVGLALLLRRRLRCSSLIAAPREERY